MFLTRRGKHCIVVQATHTTPPSGGRKKFGWVVVIDFIEGSESQRRSSQKVKKNPPLNQIHSSFQEGKYSDRVIPTASRVQIYWVMVCAACESKLKASVQMSRNAFISFTPPSGV